MEEANLAWKGALPFWAKTQFPPSDGFQFGGALAFPNYLLPPDQIVIWVLFSFGLDTTRVI